MVSSNHVLLIGGVLATLTTINIVYMHNREPNSSTLFENCVKLELINGKALIMSYPTVLSFHMVTCVLSKLYYAS